MPILFYGASHRHGWLSNWSPHAIKDESGNEFKTVEHFLMWRKAKLMGDEDSAALILQAKTPIAAKRLGRRIKPWDEELWTRERAQVMKDGIALKTRQHPLILAKLRATENMIIAEAAPRDRVWGIGLDASDPRAHDPKQWRGLNLLGQAWMAVRADI